MSDCQVEINDLKDQLFTMKEALEASQEVFDWYFIFGEDNQRARELLADLGNKLAELPKNWAMGCKNRA